MSELFYPTIDLFIYDLKSPLNLGQQEIDQNLDAFKNRLPPNTKLQDVKHETEYLPLIEENIDHIVKLNSAHHDLQGYYYPVCINDACGLQIDCSIEDKTKPYPIDSSFSRIKAEIEQKYYPNDLYPKALTFGQSWLLSGWLTEQNQDAESIARDCCKALFEKNTWTPEFYGKGTFLKGDILEIWQSQDYPHTHVIVALFPNKEMADKISDFYTDWMMLFCSRHKITWAYHQSRSIKEALVNHYKKVEKNAVKINNKQDSKVFSNIQNILNQYTIDLLNLSFQKQIIEINLVNYRTRLEIIRQKAGEESDLSFLDKFSHLVEKKYLLQIAKDTENMQLGLKLLETNINALRSQIELEKSERDRNFQNLVTIVGTGTAVATFIDFTGEKCKKILKDTPFKDNMPFCDNFWIGNVLVPFTFLILLGLIAWILKKLLFEKSK